MSLSSLMCASLKSLSHDLCLVPTELHPQCTAVACRSRCSLYTVLSRHTSATRPAERESHGRLCMQLCRVEQHAFALALEARLVERLLGDERCVAGIGCGTAAVEPSPSPPERRSPFFSLPFGQACAALSARYSPRQVAQAQNEPASRRRPSNRSASGWRRRTLRTAGWGQRRSGCKCLCP